MESWGGNYFGEGGAEAGDGCPGFNRESAVLLPETQDPLKYFQLWSIIGSPPCAGVEGAGGG